MKSTNDLLTEIRRWEGGPGAKGYGQVYGGAPKKFRDKDVSKMTLGEIIRFQSDMKRAGSKSTAVGGYQFIKNTFLATLAQMGLLGSGNLVWTPELQDKMAMHLLKLRGYQKFLDGKISRETFANNLAAEWASLPMVTGPKKGKSKYAGDGLNKSHHSVSSILALLDAIKAEYLATKKG